MTHPKFKLEVISHLSQFKNKSLRQYYVDGINTVGAWGDEPFEIKFSNMTGQKVQVKISLDGTDVFTGEQATTEPTPSMWVVQAYSTMSLKAWPETSNGGAAFIFTSANNSVAVHTHGDLSARGIIAAAVYVEGHVEPVRLNPAPEIHNHYHYDYYNPYIWTYPYTIGGGGTFSFGGAYTSSGGTVSGSTGLLNNVSNHVVLNNTNAGSNVGGTRERATFDSLCFNEVAEQGGVPSASDGSKALESLVSVGAGQHVDQQITYVAGLIKPTLTETVRVRYLWWDDLVAKLKETSVAEPHASGFPGDKAHKNIDLKGTPRKVGSFRRVPDSVVQYQRV